MENKIQLPTTSMKMKSDDGVNDLPVQVGTLWNIEDTYVSRTPFCIKNISDENITLSVRLYGMTELIETVFYPGWNIELVTEVKGAPSGVIQGGRL